MVRRDKPGSSPEGDWAAIAPYVGHGFTMVGAMLLFGLGGWWLDGRLGTSPWFVIAGLFLGAGAGFYNSYYHIIVEPGLRKGSGAEDQRTAERD